MDVSFNISVSSRKADLFSFPEKVEIDTRSKGEKLMQTSVSPDWVPVGLEAQIQPASSHPVIVNGYGLAVWRGETGDVQIWEDRCPHRGMRLSFGFVQGNRLVCLYHGWEYEKGGQCSRIPAHPDLEPPKTICTKTYDSRSHRGIVFTRLSGDAEPAFAPEDGWRAVRSIFAAVPLAQAAAYLESATNVFGGPAIKDGSGFWVLGVADGIEITFALQPIEAGRTAIHITCRGADDVRRQALALTAVRMRRELELS